MYCFPLSLSVSFEHTMTLLDFFSFFAHLSFFILLFSCPPTGGAGHSGQDLSFPRGQPEHRAARAARRAGANLCGKVSHCCRKSNLIVVVLFLFFLLSFPFISPICITRSRSLTRSHTLSCSHPHSLSLFLSLTHFHSPSHIRTRADRWTGHGGRHVALL